MCNVHIYSVTLAKANASSMKKLFSTNYSTAAFNVALLLLRLIPGFLMMNHGYQKLVGFAEMKNGFMNFLGMGSTFSLCLVIFAEFFCSLFLILGLFSRLAAVPLVIAMAVAFFMAHNHDFYGKGEMAVLFLSIYLAILIVGPGKISIDNMIR